MVDDPLRTAPLLAAIRDTVQNGDIVADIGAGLGILSLEAISAGAEKVYAIECDLDAADELSERVEDLDLEKKIEVITALSFDVELGRKADVIICETVGSFAFDENILATLLDARTNILAVGGGIIPLRLELWGALVSDFEGPDLDSFIAEISKQHLASAPALISSVDFSGAFDDSIHEIKSFTSTRGSLVSGLALWPKVSWNAEHVTDASPLKPLTHWKQGILRLEPKKLEAGDSASIEIIMGPHPDDPLTMTEKLWRWK